MTATRPMRAVYSTDHGTDCSRAPHRRPRAAAAPRPPAPEREEFGTVIDEFLQAAEQGEARGRLRTSGTRPKVCASYAAP